MEKAMMTNSSAALSPTPSPTGQTKQLCFFSRVHLNVSQEEVNSCRSALWLGPAYSCCPSSFLACVVSLRVGSLMAHSHIQAPLSSLPTGAKGSS